jgi:hypothetical protein
VAAFIAIVPLAQVLMCLPFFHEIKQPIPPALPRPTGLGRPLFWGLFVFSSLLACFTYLPICNLSQLLFEDAHNRNQTWFFPQRMNNAVMLWAVLNGSVGILLFAGTYLLFGRKNGARSENWGVRISFHLFMKSILLAALIAIAYFMLLFSVYYFFHVDYRFVFLGVRTFQPATLTLLAMYAPLFFIFFFSNSLRVNSAMRFEKSVPWRSTLLAALANTMGLALIQVIQYSSFVATGTVFWTDDWLYVNLLFAVVPMMFILPIYHIHFFRMTGSNWLGPITMCFIFITILLSNTVCYLPL